MKVVSVIAQKGGTGNTTLNLAIACAAAANELSITVVDTAHAANDNAKRATFAPTRVSRSAPRRSACAPPSTTRQRRE